MPAIISWPGHLPEGEVRDQVTHSCDWMPTLAEFCQVKLPNSEIDGRSVIPVLNSATAAAAHDTLHWLVGAGDQPQWAVRQGDWKLIGNVQSAGEDKLSAEDRKLFLSNLATDPSERSNLAKEFPDVVLKLSERHKSWVAECQQKISKATSQDKAGNEK